MLPAVRRAPGLTRRDSALTAKESPKMPSYLRPDRPGEGVEEGSAPASAPTILLVDDVQRVRRVVREMLALDGYEVIEAGSAREALEIAARGHERIDLLLTDVVMPDMGGLELAERIRALCPDLRLLFMSGYTDAPLVRDGLSEGPAFIAKPFSATALARKLREVLGR
jgi:CheY-like chemotaxis protein